MINARRLPQTAARSANLPEPFQKTAVRTAAASEHILFEGTTKTQHDVTIRAPDDRRTSKRKTPHAKSSSKRQNANAVRRDPDRRRHAVFATKQMDLMAQIAKPLGCLVEIPFGSALEIKAFMRKGDFQFCEP